MPAAVTPTQRIESLTLLWDCLVLKTQLWLLHARESETSGGFSFKDKTTLQVIMTPSSFTSGRFGTTLKMKTCWICHNNSNLLQFLKKVEVCQGLNIWETTQSPALADVLWAFRWCSTAQNAREPFATLDHFRGGSDWCTREKGRESTTCKNGQKNIKVRVRFVDNCSRKNLVLPVRCWKTPLLFASFFLPDDNRVCKSRTLLPCPCHGTKRARKEKSTLFSSQPSLWEYGWVGGQEVASQTDILHTLWSCSCTLKLVFQFFCFACLEKFWKACFVMMLARGCLLSVHSVVLWFSAVHFEIPVKAQKSACCCPPDEEGLEQRQIYAKGWLKLLPLWLWRGEIQTRLMLHLVPKVSDAQTTSYAWVSCGSNTSCVEKSETKQILKGVMGARPFSCPKIINGVEGPSKVGGDELVAPTHVQDPRDKGF